MCSIAAVVARSAAPGATRLARGADRPTEHDNRTGKGHYNAPMPVDPSAPSSLPLPPPSSAAFGQNSLFFRIYLIYRAVLSVIFLMLIALPATRELVGARSPDLYTTVSVIFLLSNLVLIGAAAQLQRSNTDLVTLFLVDVGCITLLADASGGDSSLPILLTISVAFSAILIENRAVATLVAALTVLATLADTLRLVSIGEADLGALFPAGLLGLLCFVVSGLVQLTVLALGKAETIASKRAADLYRLQRLNEQIVQNMRTGILIVDMDKRTRVFNRAVGRLLDPTRPVALEQGRCIDDYSPELARRLDSFRRSGEQRGSPFPSREDGAEVVARFQALEDSDEHQTLVFLDDYRPVAAYAQSLKLNSLSRLAGSIAHEIRNPLGAISHATQLLQESDAIAVQDRRMIDIVLSNSQRVNDIVESVLQLSRREPPRPDTLELADWIEEYEAHYRQVREEPGDLFIEFVDPRARILFDAEHLRRILDNLVDNAMRHAKAATGEIRAEIRIRVDRHHQDCVIEVCDHGIGVDEADVPRLFEPFFTRSSEGTGLGLYLCRELCELNQARIAYAPTSDGRSRFQITIGQHEP